MNAPHTPELAALADALDATPLSPDALWAGVARSHAVIEFDLEGRILQANAPALQMLGYAAEELVGRLHRVLCEEEFTRSQAYLRFWQKLARGEADAGEYQHLAKTGRELWLQASYLPVADSDGRPARVVMLGTDVTLNRQILAEARGRLAALDRAQAVVEFNLAGNIQGANDCFLALSGYGLRELAGQHHGMLCPGSHLATPQYAELWSRLGQGESVSGRYPFKSRHGDELQLQVSYSPVLDAAGKPLKVLMFATDVTAQVRLEQQRRDRSATVLAPVARLLGSLGEIAAAAQAAETTVQGSVAEAARATALLDGSAQAMAGIEAAADEMSEIVKLVSGIAGQTTVLAFTAALEAVRAGEQGSGFAAVAEELRQLADRSTLAASQSSRLIIDSVRRVAPALAASQQASAAFGRIASDIEGTRRAIAELGQAAAAQADLAGQVNGLMHEFQDAAGAAG
ncbi:PAS domain-containing methyl-accepting chemotaxis protein [Aquabacterium sp. A7-Y]|uniref:PAS domain-containing protein n=1 Tax=Aquabacterium sp. A7-Y TaxID=1349605 RepID=UPI00223E8DDE|nr:PAS domain-containing methyl-accepting chemotaxis protein [Aquabacterium sp. A7-Y]MCW7537880.1 PAS domain-containing methyl-accepting chemotaxis protein [Aquabacterium sp. A7-Y]